MRHPAPLIRWHAAVAVGHSDTWLVLVTKCPNVDQGGLISHAHGRKRVGAGEPVTISRNSDPA